MGVISCPALYFDSFYVEFACPILAPILVSKAACGATLPTVKELSPLNFSIFLDFDVVSVFFFRMIFSSSWAFFFYFSTAFFINFLARCFSYSNLAYNLMCWVIFSWSIPSAPPQLIRAWVRDCLSMARLFFECESTRANSWLVRSLDFPYWISMFLFKSLNFSKSALVWSLMFATSSFWEGQPPYFRDPILLVRVITPDFTLAILDIYF